MFIVLDGIDGCGKSTQAKLLAEWFRSNRREVLLTAEPTKSRIGLFIREILSGNENVNPKTLALLFTADRYEHIVNEIEPALSNNRIVISERYYHSTITYQEAQGVDRKWLLDINKFARKPDMTIFLDIKPEIGVKRTTTNEIFEKKEFLEKVRDNYLKLDENMKKIDANRSKEDVFDEIKKIVSKLDF